VRSARSGATRCSWRSQAARREEDARERERAFYDAQAATRSPTAPDAYDAALLDALGPVEGASVLELGCGAGDLSLELLRRGARLTAVDISPGMVELARSRAEAEAASAKGPVATFLVAPAEDTSLPGGSFDLAVGKGVLHHVDVKAAAREVHRLLRPGGRAAFFENQDRNPVLRAARRRLWGAPSLNWVGTRDEHALTRADFDALAATFGSLELSYPSFYFFEALSRAMGHRLHGPLRGLDAFAWRRLPAVRRWSWHVLVVLER
jgi:ubiquinone/menaquinone biosynthesis C-methylase UbiE